MRIKIGITGQNGFIGQHLYNTLGLYPEEFERIPYHADFFKDDKKLNDFAGQCDVIVHLAAMNRHNDSEVIYQTNIGLVKQLILSLEQTKSKAHVIFSSSSQEESDNLYGRSKKEGRELLTNWAANSGGLFTGLVIPNVFGPFGHPNFNSFIATFSHLLIHDQQPKVEVDGAVKLIYIADLVNIIIDKIRNKKGKTLYNVVHTSENKVSDVLNLLNDFTRLYLNEGIIPLLNSNFELNLFNTFRSYIDIKNHFPIKLKQHKDERGTFVEIIRLNIGGQISFSTTLTGITRGNHFHVRKIERFAVIKGKALIQLRKIGTDEILDFYLDGKVPSYIDMPIWYTHNIKNVGEEELYTNFWINEFYDENNPDTYFEDV